MTSQINLQDMIIARDCHVKVRNELRKLLRPNMKYIEIAQFVEKRIQNILGNDKLKAGIAFPVGISVNEIVAHDSAYRDDTRFITNNDIIKIDIGTHVNGNIIDSAFSFAFDPKFTPLIEATKEATMQGIKMSRPDSLIFDISSSIKEIIESYEIEIGGQVLTVNPVGSLGGHNILPYQIHGGKLVLCKPLHDKKYVEQRMKENECYAIETFASTGAGTLFQSNNIPHTHYMLKADYKKSSFTLDATHKVFKWINTNRTTLPFNSRWIYDDLKSILGEKCKFGLNELLKKDIVTAYPVLSDVKNTFSSHMEHTIYIGGTTTEILSKGGDY